MGSRVSRISGFVATLLLLFGAFASPAQAATQTFSFVGGFSGGQLGVVTFDFTLTHDFSLTVFDQTSGLTVNSFTSSVVAGNPAPLTDAIGFDFIASSGDLRFGGGSVAALTNTHTDFRLILSFPIGDFSPVLVADTFAGTPSISNATLSSFTVTEILPAIPLPAGAVLLVTAFGGLGLLRRRFGVRTA